MAGPHSEAPKSKSPDIEAINAIMDIAGIEDADDEGFSTREMQAQRPNTSLSSIQRLAKKAVSEGKLVLGYAMRMNDAGRAMRTAVYRKP